MGPCPDLMGNCIKALTLHREAQRQGVPYKIDALLQAKERQFGKIETFVSAPGVSALAPYLDQRELIL